MANADPWAAAQKTEPAEEASSLAEGFDQPSQLFAGGGEGIGPSLFNKTHPVGTERTGIIAKPTFDRQSSNIKGVPVYWPKGRGGKPTTEPRDPATNEPNRPVMDTVIVLDTEYTMDAAEAQALQREEPFEGGRRSRIIARKEDKDKLIAAIQDYNRRNPKNPITKDGDMVGKRFTDKRVATRVNPEGGDPIKIHEFRIDLA